MDTTEPRVRAAFAMQAEACAALGSPLTARLLAGLGPAIQPGTPLADRILTWPGEPSYRGDSVPLRLAGGLHALVLREQDDKLAAVYRQGAQATDAALVDTALRAMVKHGRYLDRWLDSPPQTNEVRRSAALIAAGHLLTARHGLPLVLSELGASAGLNLLWDHYALEVPGARLGPPDPALVLTPEWRGALPPVAAPRVTDRAGTDINPLDPVEDRLRLLAYVWADQADRLDRTARALDLARSLKPRVDAMDAADWLEARLAQPLQGRLHMVFHTIAWQYFPPAVQDRCTAALEAAGAQATADAPLAHLAMELAPDGHGASLTLQVWPGDGPRRIGSADAHGRWIEWAGDTDG